jgi:hypothetical protein
VANAILLVTFAERARAGGAATARAAAEGAAGATTTTEPAFATFVAPRTTQATTPTPAPTPTPSSLISGQVIDAGTKTGIPNAVVTLSPGAQTTVTDQSGGFNFAVAPGTYTLTAAASGYAGATQTVTVKAAQTAVVTIKLNPLVATGGIKGTVTDAASGSPITGAVLVLTPTALSAVSGAGGKYSFPAVPAGSYTMTVSATGYATQVLPVTVKAGQQTTVAVGLTAV